MSFFYQLICLQKQLKFNKKANSYNHRLPLPPPPKKKKEKDLAQKRRNGIISEKENLVLFYKYTLHFCR